MGEKSDELGGQRRTLTRHGFEGGAVTAAAALLVGKFGASLGITEVWEQSAALAVLVGILGTVAKFWHENELTKRILARALPPAAGILLAVLVSGCAIQLGRVTPHEFSGAFGETVIACETVGINLAFGDADICRNTEGGHVSKTFADMTLGLVRTAAAAVAGFFSGLGSAGQGMQSALAPVPETTLEPPRTPPVDTSPAAVVAPRAPDDGGTVRAPFQ